MSVVQMLTNFRVGQGKMVVPVGKTGERLAFHDSRGTLLIRDGLRADRRQKGSSFPQSFLETPEVVASERIGSKLFLALENR